MAVEGTNDTMSFQPTVCVGNDSASDAWKRCSLEMVNLISKSTGPPLIRDYNNLFLENRDLKKQYKMAIAALDSIISKKDSAKVISNCLEINNRDCNVDDICEQLKERGILKSTEVSTTNVNSKVDRELGSAQNSESKQEQILPIEENSNGSDFNDCSNSINLRTNKKKIDVSYKKHSVPSPYSNEGTQKSVEFVCTNCLNQKSGSQMSKEHLATQDKDDTRKRQVLNPDVYQLKRELEQTCEEKNNLKKELNSVKKENSELLDQVHSLELSLKTLTEAINLQDEQLTEYGSIVTSLKNSRSMIIEKMKVTNARNSYNIMLMENIEQEAENLRRQLDAYNELLVNQNIQQIDKASSTEGTLEEQCSYEEIVKKKDNYISLLQDRLCEAIVDLKNKDSEIKNHANSVKVLISNYEAEKKGLEESLKFANGSTEKLEQHKIKQQETMRQLMKLIEFLQEKLEKVNKK